MGGYGCRYGRTHVLETLQITLAAQFNNLRLVHEHILFVAGCNIMEGRRASLDCLSASIMQVSEYVMGDLPGSDCIGQSGGANVQFLTSRVEDAPRWPVCHQHVESVGHAGVQNSQAAFICHKVPAHKRRRPWRAVETNAIENKCLIQEHVYVYSEQLAHRCRKQLEALVVIAGNNDGATGP